MIKLFQRSLQKRPLLTQVAVTGAICGAGDAFCQLAFEKRNYKTYDTVRTGRFFLLGAGFITPVLSKWFRILEKLVTGPLKIVPLKRLLVDQIMFAPIFNAAILFNLRLIEGIGVKESWRKMKEDWSTIYFNSLKVWPAVQLVNFYLIPLNMRVIVVQLVAFFWNSYLSYKTQRLVDEQCQILEIGAGALSSPSAQPISL
ncbi:hypothetical protein Q1695_006349 [Nippostrongylus brasiliensis]|nr:hypothetical protein Q1695_006349 [Nippostrongylus brasiliensis]